ncbi:hypothetical protein KS4_04420 [Poriferisphaera corsica]|uniref:Uncharacterized protein n=1 Tax=Poriferisphaera corsica TaxID=2528020 RepID=A0A517YQC6_9BACT|nr:hypothetical protein KS4_04420 [Poriferisphaera corsica]
MISDWLQQIPWLNWIIWIYIPTLSGVLILLFSGIFSRSPFKPQCNQCHKHVTLSSAPFTETCQHCDNDLSDSKNIHFQRAISLRPLLIGLLLLALPWLGLFSYAAITVPKKNIARLERIYQSLKNDVFLLQFQTQFENPLL